MSQRPVRPPGRLHRYPARLSWSHRGNDHCGACFLRLSISGISRTLSPVPHSRPPHRLRCGGRPVHRLARHPCSQRRHEDGYRGYRGLHRHRASVRQSTGPRPRAWKGGRSSTGPCPTTRSACVRSTSACRQRGRCWWWLISLPPLGPGGGSGHGHHRGLPARAVDATNR